MKKVKKVQFNVDEFEKILIDHKTEISDWLRFISDHGSAEPYSFFLNTVLSGEENTEFDRFVEIAKKYECDSFAAALIAWKFENFVEQAKEHENYITDTVIDHLTKWQEETNAKIEEIHRCMELDNRFAEAVNKFQSEVQAHFLEMETEIKRLTERVGELETGRGQHGYGEGSANAQ